MVAFVGVCNQCAALPHPLWGAPAARCVQVAAALQRSKNISVYMAAAAWVRFMLINWSRFCSGGAPYTWPAPEGVSLALHLDRHGCKRMAAAKDAVRWTLWPALSWAPTSAAIHIPPSASPPPSQNRPQNRSSFPH